MISVSFYISCFLLIKIEILDNNILSRKIIKFLAVRLLQCFQIVYIYQHNIINLHRILKFRGEK